MKKYLLWFGLAWALSTVLAFAMLVAALAGWMFSETPLWFDLLYLIVTAFPYLFIGEVAGRRAQPVENLRRGMLLLLCVMTGVALMGGLADNNLRLISVPGWILGSLLARLLPLSGYWEGALILLGHLLLPLLYHLGWHWGKTESC